ncbi:FAD dependent oxidoreductase [Aspergillus crustosus]
MSQPDAKILIIGAGIFGVSTACHLAKTLPDPSQIILLDPAPAPSAASSVSKANIQSIKPGASADINKIIRADYSSPLYMSLGFEAINAWKTLPIFQTKNVYRQSGWIAMDEKDSDVPTLIRENFANGKHDGVIVDMTQDEVKKAWGGVLEKTEYGPFGSYYFNPVAGWADASGALELMLEDAIGLGVRYVQGDAGRLLFRDGDGGGVEGVELAGGGVLTAEKVLLATGAWTSQVMAGLEDELGIADEDRVEGQVSAAGVCVAHFQLSEEEKEVYEKLPVLVYGGQGEVIPPTSTGILKFTSTTSFKNSVRTASGHEISAPIEDQSYAPKGLQEDALSAVRARLPQLLDNGRKPDDYRLCWDSISASQHPLITQHPDPRLANLYFAVGGSFHFYKFLPIIGKYVANVLHGAGNGREMDKAWGWKLAEENERGVHASLIPRFEYSDFV